MMSFILEAECRREGERGGVGGGAGATRPARFGEPACDSPLSLVESAARHMRTRHADNVEFVLWTGISIKLPTKNDDSLHMNNKFKQKKTLSIHESCRPDDISAVVLRNA
ncbi:hypothetical protein EVAR_32802_1 [Eumeta japonica]|uniref:Uncharacterized protein n=1 Tax=Eumeta variegata TaxID=151549 RepID=A0A4C1WBK4_EUMVA|nr:hypothetical protein EVAR_32802_1 [Eumeta japonica]